MNDAVEEIEGESFEIVIVGAGFSGLAALKRVRALGMSSVLLEAGSDVGGTWYWNRYPGARTDSESWVYCFSDDPDLLQEWDWSERYPRQDEVLAYLKRVAEKNDLYRDIRFDTYVRSAEYKSAANRWIVTTKDGKKFAAKYLLTAIGILSEPYFPDIPGVERFAGEIYQTARWPHVSPSFEGKRVGIIGAGATSVQAAPIIAAEAKHLTVFQRTPNYVLPGQNYVMSDPHKAEVKSNYAAVWAKAKAHAGGLPYDEPQEFAHLTPEARRVVLEDAWSRGGFKFLFETFSDILTSEEANGAAADFVREKIKEVVKDPDVADKLIPRDYFFMAKRPPVGHQYYEMYNRDNVTLVDLLNETSIKEVLPTGVQTDDKFHELDVLIFATGFDGYTGAFSAIDIVGEAGLSLKEHWQDGARSVLGTGVHGFPNLLTVFGPLTPLANAPISIELCANFIGGLLKFARDNGVDRIEGTVEGEDWWVSEAATSAAATLLVRPTQVTSWLHGTNIPGKAPGLTTYVAGAAVFGEHCQAEAEAGYPHFSMVSSGSIALQKAS